MNPFFFLRTRKYFITQGMGQSSMFLTFRKLHVILGRGLGLWVGWGEDGRKRRMGGRGGIP